MEYASVVWAYAGRTLLKRIDAVQDTALRVIAGTSGGVDLAALHWDLDVQRLGIRRLDTGARVAAQLQRMGDECRCSQEFRAWVARTKPYGSPPPSFPIRARDAYRAPPKCHGKSPFAFLIMASRSLKMDLCDVGKEYLERRQIEPVPAPWDTPVEAAAMSLAPEWPVLGSAGTRSPEQTKAGQKWHHDLIGMGVIQASLEEKHLIVAHTDGSAYWDAVGGGGAAAVWQFLPSSTANSNTTWVQGGHDRVQTGSLSHNFHAEMVGVILALERVRIHASGRGWELRDSRLMIVSDCQEVVRRLISVDDGQSTPFWSLTSRASNLLLQLESAGLSISLEWSPGHAGVEQNDRADEMAKLAAVASRTNPGGGMTYPRPLSLVRNACRMRARDHDHAMFLREGKAKALRRNLAPLAAKAGSSEEAQPLARLLHMSMEDNQGLKWSRQTQVALVKLRLGNTPTRGMLDRVGVTGHSLQESLCICGATDNTVLHRVLKCGHYAGRRRPLRDAIIRAGVPYSMRSALGLAGVPVTARAGIFSAWEEFLSKSGLGDLATRLPRAPD
jgi:ribonuclease HI